MPTKKQMTDAEKKAKVAAIDQGFQIDRDIFFAVWMKVAKENGTVDDMVKDIQSRCGKMSVNKDKVCKKETVRAKMNYYKRREATLRGRGVDIEMPPVIRDERKSLKELTAEWRTMKNENNDKALPPIQ
tara:strand:- start:1885 stop:2271 length:387 start_codon:yes stop_codon:yes gene_type:complete